MNIKDAYIHNGDAILKDIQLNGSKLQKLKAGKNADDTYLIWDDVVDLSPFGASGHNHDDRYFKLTGGKITGPVTFEMSNDRKIYINNSDDETYWSLISFQQKGTEYGTLGTAGSTDLQWNGHNLYHAGNLTASVIGNLGTLSNNISGNAATATYANFFVGCNNTITVAGDANTYYPVMISTTTNKKSQNIITIWKDLGSKTASYPENHSNGSSSMLYRYDIRNCYWDGNGGYCTTLDARYMYARLVAETMMLSNGVGNFCIWLRGGGTEYNINTSWYISSSDINIYYSSTNVGSSTYPVTIAPRTDIGNGGVYNTITIPCNVKYAATANWAASAGSATYVLDVNDSSTTTFAYSKAGLSYGDYTWLAGWNGYELRAVNKSQFAQASHTHTKSQITDFPTSLPANGGYADAIASKGILDSQEKIDNFITPYRFEYALFRTTDANNVDFAGNDGMILSIPWNSTTYGAQIAFDDSKTGTVKVRGKFDTWGNWYTLLHSGNYTTYTVKKDGTGASGNWGISITGNAATATTSTYASNVGSSGTVGTNYVTAANVISMYNWYNSITATDDASNTAIDKWNEIVSFLTGITDTSTLSGILAGYAAAGHNHDGRYIKWGGSAADTNAMTWGTLTAANGYTILSHTSSSDGGDWGMVNQGGKIYMQLDGYYYQNEGQYRVTDVSETVTALGTSGNYLTWTKNGSTNNITIPYATKADNSDTVDGYHISDNYNLPYKNITNLTCTPSSITGDYWYVKILIQSSYQSIANQKMYLIASYSNLMTKAELQVYGYYLGYKYTASWYNEDTITGIASTRQDASQVIWLRMKKPIQYEGVIPNGNISIYSNYIASAEVITSAPSYVIFTDTLQSDGQHILSGDIKAASFKKNGSDDNYVLLGGGGHKALTDFSMSHSHPYLPLSGGTMTGSIWMGINDLNFNGSDPGDIVWFDENGNETERIWSSKGSGSLNYRTNAGTTYTLYHSGNLTSLPANGGDADTVDNYHASNLTKFYLSPMEGSAPASSAKSWFENTMLAGTGAIVYNVPGSEKTIIAGKSTGPYGHMLQLNYDDTYLRILRYRNGSWASEDWEKISAGYADIAGSIAWDNVTGKPINFKAYSGSLSSGGWKIMQGKDSSPSIAISYNNSSAPWNSETYSASMVWGCSDTRGLLDCGYNTPIVTFGGCYYGGSDDNNPTWYMKISGTNGTIYNLNSMPYAVSAGSVERATFGDHSNGPYDANAMTSNGLYYYSSNGPTTNAHNFETNDGSMYVQAYNTSWVSQIAQDYRSGKLAVRSRNNGTWQPWRRIAFADSDYVISADKMHYEPEHRKFTRTASGYSWDTQAYSVCGYKECRVTYKISQTGAYIMVGLNSDPTTDASYQSIDYCWYTENIGTLSIYENGTHISSISGHTTYAVGDELIVEYSCGQVRYYHNGVLCRTVARTYGSPLYFDCSFYNAGSIENVVFEPIHDSLDFVQTTASYSLSNAAWTNTITLPTTAGSYILNIVSGNSTLTGVFSIGASDNAKDEISLHLHGNGPRLYARTNGTTLQLSSNDASATSRSVTIKYRRMI